MKVSGLSIIVPKSSLRQNDQIPFCRTFRGVFICLLDLWTDKYESNLKVNFSENEKPLYLMEQQHFSSGFLLVLNNRYVAATYFASPKRWDSRECLNAASEVEVVSILWITQWQNVPKSLASSSFLQDKFRLETKYGPEKPISLVKSTNDFQYRAPPKPSPMVFLTKLKSV